MMTQPDGLEWDDDEAKTPQHRLNSAHYRSLFREMDIPVIVWKIDGLDPGAAMLADCSEAAGDLLGMPHLRNEKGARFRHLFPDIVETFGPNMIVCYESQLRQIFDYEWGGRRWIVILKPINGLVMAMFDERGRDG